MKGSSLWGEHPVPAEGPALWNVGPLRIWAKRRHNELWLAHQYGDAEGPATPDEATWSRWVLKESYGKIRFTPRFPERPVVVKPELSFLLTRRAEARIYVRCPIWVRVEVCDPGALDIIEIPSVTLSSTWFGAFTEGDLCYWISSGARRQAEADPARRYLAICPIRIVNQSEEELEVETLCFRVEGLSLFLKEGHLWADESTLVFGGKDKGSLIRVTGTAPPEAAGAELISLPREPAKQGIAARTFASLRDFSGLGLR